MNRSRVLPVAVSLTAVVALLLTGCGGDKKDSGNDKTPDAGSGSARSTSPSGSGASEASEAGRPEMKFPADVQLNFDDGGVAGPDQKAALGDAENFVRAVIYGIVRQDKNDPVYKYYSEFQSPAQDYGKQQIDASVGAGLTVTGVSRYTHVKVQPINGTKDTVVTFCSNDSKFYSKEVKTKKVRKTKESVRDYTFWQIGMNPSTTVHGLWRANEIKVQGRVARCGDDPT